LAIVISAGEWAKHHPSETAAHVAREVNSSEPFVGRAYPDVHVRLVTDLREPWIDALRRYTTFLAHHGFVRSDFNVRSWIDEGPIKALRDMGVLRIAV